MKRLAPYLVLIVTGLLAAWQLAVMAPDHEDPEVSGMEVYLGEGCIHCHSQYSRPAGRDTGLWGSVTELPGERGENEPVLLGNRRQGPDLSNVGLRRSRQWNRLHLEFPRLVRKGSRMPSYAHLFSGKGRRGEVLLDYLQSLGQDNRPQWTTHVENWVPEESLAGGNGASGGKLFAEYCAGCHGRSGSGDGPLARELQPAPRDLTRRETWQWIQPELDETERRLETARLLKFGRAGTGMAGTEWLRDDQLADLIRFLETLGQGQES